jgi:hypothetical protein
MALALRSVVYGEDSYPSSRVAPGRGNAAHDIPRAANRVEFLVLLCRRMLDVARWRSRVKKGKEGETNNAEQMKDNESPYGAERRLRSPNAGRHDVASRRSHRSIQVDTWGSINLCE